MPAATSTLPATRSTATPSRSAGLPRRSCSAQSPPGVMEQESEYLAALESAATYRIEGDLLEMRTAADQIAVMMTRKTAVDLPEPPPLPTAPWARVTAPQGVTIHAGPGVDYPVIGFARDGDEGEIVGRDADWRWWAVSLPSAPDGVGWVSADLVLAMNVENVPVIEAPPPPVVPTRRAANGRTTVYSNTCSRHPRRRQHRSRHLLRRQRPYHHPRRRPRRRSRSGPTGRTSSRASALRSAGRWNMYRRCGSIPRVSDTIVSPAPARVVSKSAQLPRRPTRCASCWATVRRPSVR